MFVRICCRFIANDLNLDDSEKSIKNRKFWNFLLGDCAGKERSIRYVYKLKRANHTKVQHAHLLFFTVIALVLIIAW